jgi:hypothetical protein
MLKRPYAFSAERSFFPEPLKVEPFSFIADHNDGVFVFPQHFNPRGMGARGLDHIEQQLAHRLKQKNNANGAGWPICCMTICSNCWQGRGSTWKWPLTKTDRRRVRP